jgi:phage shock protein A
MYRTYENPRALENELKQAKQELAALLGSYAVIDDDEVMDLQERIADLEERVNFAWQDDEAECEGWE